MSDLQIALIASGVVLVALVWFYNLWQEKKQRQRAEAMLPETPSDVLMADRGARNEPEFGSAKADAVLREPTFTEAEEPPSSETRSVDLLLDDLEIGEVGARPETVPVPAEWSDGRADCMVRIEFVDRVPVPALWAEQATWSGAIDKPIQWLGLDERSQRWRTLLPQDAGAVAQLAVALQLVDRKGAVSDATLGAFIDGVQRLSQRFAGLTELPAKAPLLSLATDLDAFCASVDLQLALHVLPSSAGEMAGAQLQSVLDADRLKLEGERFVAMDEAGAEAFALVCQAPTVFSAARFADMSLSDLIFSLDVPRVADGAAAFDRMIACARRCAEALGGQLADGHRKPLTDATIAAIRGRIQDLQRQMAEKDISAGSMRALRLFS